MSVELISAAYHRNGVGGAGFYVALFTDKVENPGRTFLATMFVDSICQRCGGSGIGAPASAGVPCPTCDGTGEVTPKYVAQTAVIDVAQAVGGNIFMHPAFDEDGVCIALGGNAWRGADEYSHILAPLVLAAVEQGYENNRKAYTKKKS